MQHDLRLHACNHPFFMHFKQNVHILLVASGIAGKTPPMKPTDCRMVKSLRRGFAAGGLTVLTAMAPAATEAAGLMPTIDWTSPGMGAYDISGEADVRTDGTLMVAVNLGSTAPVTMVNGVPFMGFGNEAFQTLTGSTETPFASLTEPYQNLLSLGMVAGYVTVGFGDLIPGHLYLFQWWSNDSLPNEETGQLQVLPEDHPDNALVLSSNVTASAGGLGQYGVGTFIANEEGLTIRFEGLDGAPAVLNALQLRDLTPVPEPGVALGLSGLLAGALLLRRRP